MEKYPLYSRADEALYLLGQDYEGQIAQLRVRPVCTAMNTPPGCVGTESTKAKVIEEWTKEASAAYSQIITRYPAMERETDAKKRLAALHQPIPRPTKAALAQNRAEEESRREASALDQLMSVLKKGPDVANAAKVGDPTLADPTPLSANQISGETMRKALGGPADEHGLSGEIVKGGPPGGNEPAPRSDATPANSQPFARPNPAADPNELKPAAPDPNELKPAVESQSAASADAPAPPPVQLNEIQQAPAGSGAVASSSSTSELATDKDVSSSKKKKKKGLKKILAPF